MKLIILPQRKDQLIADDISLFLLYALGTYRRPARGQFRFHNEHPSKPRPIHAVHILVAERAMHHAKDGNALIQNLDKYKSTYVTILPYTIGALFT